MTLMTADATDEQRSIEQLEALAGEWKIACEFRTDDEAEACGDDADWWILCRRCRHTLAECDPHRREQLHIFDSWSGLIHCTHCDATVTRTRWRELFDVFPIGGRP